MLTHARADALNHGFPPAPASAPPLIDKRSAAERRAAKRTRTVFRIAKVVRDAAVGLWRVRNISDLGMMLRTHVPVKKGERLTIALSESVELDGKVVWTDGEACGVAFDQPIDSAEILRFLVNEQHERGHRAFRLNVDVRAAAYCERGLHAIRITDVTHHGIGFSHDGCLKAGMKTLVMFENGMERRGVVRWSHDGRAGLQLAEPFTCAELEGDTFASAKGQ